MKFEKTKIYGVTGINKNKWLTRTDDAVGLGYDMPNEEEYVSDFDYCYPWCDMQEIIQDDNVFIKIPKFYAKVSENDDGSYKYQISGCRYEGFSTLFIDGKGNEIDYILVGKYEATTMSGGIVYAYSRPSGASLIINTSIDTVRTNCAQWGAGYQQYDFLIDWIIKLLFTVEFATTMSQNILAGCTQNSTVQNPGASDVWTAHTAGGGSLGGVTNKLYAMKYRGIENLWGNTETWCDGIAFLESKIYLCTDPTAYSHNADTTSLDAPYFYVGDRILYDVCQTKEVTPFKKIPLLGFTTSVSTTGTENSTAYGSDQYRMCTSGNGTALMCGGGNASDYFAGLWHWYDNGYTPSGDEAANATTKTNVNKAGGRLCYKPI